MERTSRKIAVVGIILVAVLLVGNAGWKGGDVPGGNLSAEKGAENVASPLLASRVVFGSGAETGETSRTSALSPVAARETAFYKTGGEPVPLLGANVFLLTDLETREVFASSHTKQQWPLASLTKLMTAALAIEKFNLNAEVPLSENHFPTGGANAQSLAPGRYKVSELLKALLLISSNEAAEALAAEYGRAQFIAAMNDKANTWGLLSTHFDDPSGLSIANQGTANDLSMMIARIYEQYPEIFEITRVRFASAANLGSGEIRTLTNINLFAGRDDFRGGKTGFTSEANGNLVSIFSYGGRPVVAIVLGTGDPELIREFAVPF
ncbi:MAG: serine hydrolase, partial [Patescibacteria group bacterium]